MAPTLFGRKTENCRTNGPPIFEVVSGKSICMLFESPAKFGKGNISLSTFHFQPNLLVPDAVTGFKKGVLGKRGACPTRLRLGGRSVGQALRLPSVLALPLILPRIGPGDGTGRKRVVGVAARKVSGAGKAGNRSIWRGVRNFR